MDQQIFGNEVDGIQKCGIDVEGIIQLTMAGNLSKETMDTFHAWAHCVKMCMQEAHAKDPNKVLTLIDARDVQETDDEGVEELKKLMAFNKDYATKTAVYGLNYFTRIITEMALHFTKRKNMKFFKNKEEALEWLLDDTKK